MMRKILLSGLVFLMNHYSFSQVKAPQITPLSPNAAALWKYNELPVNLFTGIPSISIPIYEIKSGNISLPITLNYHAGGIRYEEQASWVGLGWMLSTGGAVTRNVKGFPDERAGGIIASTNSLNTSIDLCNYEYFVNVLNKVYDTQPDEFSYSFPGGSGQFKYLQGQSNPVTIPYSPVKINYTLTSSIDAFKITDLGGTMYSFAAKESTNGGAGIFYEDVVPSAYNLTEIKSADLSRIITLNYQTPPNAIQKQSRSDQFSIIDRVVDGANPGSACTPPSPGSQSNSSQNLLYLTTPQYITEILFDGGKVEFVQSTTNRADIVDQQKSLEFIKIYVKQGSSYTLVRQFKFIYSYFQKLRGYTVTNASYKLKLDKLQVLGSGGSVMEEFNFEYFTTSFSGLLAGNDDYSAQDYWGFYNGEEENTNLIPKQQISVNYGGFNLDQWVGGADRDPNPVFMTEGVLKKIIYPTKGYTQFEFETHKYYEGVAKYAGGLRVKTIETRSSANDQPIIKTYKYGQGMSGYGVKNFSNNIGYFSQTDASICRMGLEISQWVTRTFTSAANMQIDGADGTPVVYPYVTEFFGTETLNNGRIDYIYDHGNPVGDNYYFPGTGWTNQFERQTMHHLRGHLTSKTVYAADNKKVSEETNTYQILNEIDLLAGMLVDQLFSYTLQEPYTCPSWEGDLPYKYAYAYYRTRSAAVLPLKTISRMYNAGDPGKSMTEETDFVFDPNYLLPLETTKNLRKLASGYEEQVKELTKYPFQYTFTAAPSGSDAQGIKLLQDKNMFSAPIEQYKVKRWKDPTTWTTSITGGTITTYRNDFPNPSKVFQIESASPVTSASFGTGSTITSNAFTKHSTYKEKLEFTSYDAYSNITQYKKYLDVTNAYLWDYQNLYPVAEVTNATLANIAFTSFETENKGNWTYSGIVTTDATAPTGDKCYLPSAGNSMTKTGLTSGTTYIVSYWINNTAPITITGTIGAAVKGRTLGNWTYYQHRVTGVTQVNISSTNYVDEVRLYPEGSQMTTYTFKPLIGVWSKCDPVNRIVYYEYDDLGRLIIVRDQDRNIINTNEYKYRNN